MSGTPLPRPAAHRADLRAVARRHHPDLGGDLQTYLAAVAEVDRANRTRQARPRRAGLRRRWRGAVRAARSRLPRGLPGARRYVRL